MYYYFKTLLESYINNYISNFFFLNRNAMIQSLPQSNFERVENLNSKFWEVAEDSDVGSGSRVSKRSARRI